LRHKLTHEQGRVLSVSTCTPEWIVVQFEPNAPAGYTVFASDFEKVQA